jgi:hypothetical protein
MASGTTSVYLIPYPLSSDPVNVHGDIKALSDRLEVIFPTKVDKDAANTLTKTNTYTLSGTDNGIIINQAGTGVPLRITNTGTGNSFLVEDSANPDSTPFVIDASGNVGIGKTTPTVLFDVAGIGAFSGALTASTFNALTLTAASTGFTIAGGTTSKTLTISNTLTLAGTDATTMTFPSTSQSIAGLTATQLFTNKSLSDSTTYIVDAADNTKRLQFDVTGTTGITGIFQTAFTTAKTVTFQDVAGSVYVSTGTDVTLADGGTNASLTASNGGIVYSTASAMAILAGTATAGQMLQSGATTAPAWSTATFPSTATSTGTILRANGTNWVASTSTFADTYAVNTILFASTANTITGLTTANNQVLVTGATGIPAFSGTLPSGVTASSLTSFGTSPTLTTPTIDTINASTATAAVSLYPTSTSATITLGTLIGSTAATGTINIANNAGIAGGTKAINIGTGATAGTTTIIIGSTTSTTTTLNGTINTTSGSFKVGNTSLVQGGTVNITFPTLAGTLVGTGDSGSIVTAMLANSTNTTTGVTYAKMQYVSAQYNILGRITAASGVVEELTPNNLVTVLAQSTTRTGGTTNIVFDASPTITTPKIDTINTNTGAATAAALWGDVTTGSITVGNALTGNMNLASAVGFTGTVAIANASTSAHTINISNGAGTNNKTINIGTASTAGTTAITLGSTAGATSTIALNGTVTTTGNLTVGGDLAVNGTLTTINSNTTTVDDKNLELGSVVAGTVSTTGTIGTVSGAGPFTATITGMSATTNIVPGSIITATGGTGNFGAGTMSVVSIVSNTSITVSSTATFTAGTVTNILSGAATDATANGGGITLRGATDKSIIWDVTNNNWTSSENWNIPTGKTFKINNVSVLSSTAVLGLTPTINATGYTLSGGTTPVAVTFAGGSAYTISGTNGQTYTLSATGGTIATNPMTILGDLTYGGASGLPTRLAGNATNGVYFLRENVTASASVAPDWIGSTGSGNVVLATAPAIAGGTHTGLTSLGIRDTSAAFDVTIAATSSTALTAGRSLTLDLINAARTVKLNGNIDLGGNLTTASSLTTAGAFALTLTTTNTTNATIPSGTVTLVDLATSQALTNKTISGLTVSTSTGTLTIPNATITFSGANNTTITTTGVTTITLPTTGTLAANVTTTIGDTIYASATASPGTLARLAGNTTTTATFLRSTGDGTNATAPAWQSSTGTGNVVLATAPTIAGGSISGLTGLAVRDTSAAFDVTIAAVSSPILTAGRTLTINMQNAARNISLAGDISLAGTLTTAAAFTTAGAFATTITSTGISNATLPAGTTTLAANVTTTIGDIIYASATGTPGTLARLAGNTAVQPSFLTSTGNGTANTTTSFTTSTGSGSVVLGTSPTIAGGTHTALTSLGIRDTSAAFDVTIAAVSSTALTAGRTLTIDMINAARSIKLAGNIDIAGNLTTASSFTTSGANALTLTTTGSTNVTLPTTGTLATNVTTTIGDLIYASATGTPGTLARLAGNTTTSRRFLRQTGDGTNSTAPVWDALIDGDIPSTLTGKSYNGLTLTSTTGTFTLTNAKTFAVNNTMTLSSAGDGNNLNIGTGGTLGSAAFTASTAYISSTLMTTLGDIIYGGASGAATRLAGSATNGQYFLTENVTASASVAPTWQASTGTAGSNVVLATSPTITTPKIDSITTTTGAAATPTIYSDVTTGSIAIGAGITTGTVNIATAGTGVNAINIGNTNSTLTVNGNLTVNGTTTTVNSVTITVDDPNIELNSVASPTDANANGGGITLKGTSDKTIIWDTTNSNWTANQDFNIPTGKVYKINNTAVLSPTVVLGLTPTTSGTGFAIAGGATSKTLTVQNTLTLAGTDSSTLNIGLGGTLGSAAFTASTSYISSTLMTTLGDVIYGGASGTSTRLAGNTTATRKFFRQTGDGTNSAAPVWDTLLDADIPSALTGKSYNGLTLTSTTGTFTLTAAKTFAVQNTITLAGTDSSTLNIGAGGNLGTGAFATIANYAPLAGATFTGQIESNLANSTTTGGGQIYLNGANGNRIDFNTNGLGGPTFTTRSVGTKIVLYPFLSGSTTDAAIGVDVNGVWHSLATTSASFRWYGTTTLAATLTGTGNFTTVGSVTASSIIKSGGTSSQYLMADGSVTTGVSAAAGSLTGSTLAAGVTASSLTSLGTLTSLTVSGNLTVSGVVTVPTPVNNTDAANKAYVDSVLNAGVPEIIPLDDIRGQFNDLDSRFMPTYQGIAQSITNPLRLQLAINGIIQYVDFPDYVWQSPLPREGFQIDNDGYIAFSEVVPSGSSFNANILPGPNTITKTRQYPFKAVDILIGG